MQIEDGTGKGTWAGVDSKNRLLVSSSANIESHDISHKDGLVFNLNSHIASAAAGNYVIYWKNTDTDRDLIIDVIRVGAVNAALWKAWFVTGTAAGGSATEPTNLNSNSGNAANATTQVDASITGLTAGSQIASIRSIAGASADIPFGATLIVSQGDAIAVEYDTGTTGVAETLVRGYYAPKA